MAIARLIMMLERRFLARAGDFARLWTVRSHVSQGMDWLSDSGESHDDDD